MFPPRHACAAAVVALITLPSAFASAAAPAPASAALRWHDALFPLHPAGRSLQSCRSEDTAFTSCMDETNSEPDVCATCLQRSGSSGSVDDAYTNCTSVNAYFCEAVKDCACLSPCRVQYAAYIECLMVGLVADEGKDFVCDVDCGSNSGGGSTGGGDSSIGGGGSVGGSGSSSGGGDVGSFSGGSDVGSSKGDEGKGDSGAGSLDVAEEGQVPDSGCFQRAASAFAIVAATASATGLSLLA